MSYKYSEDGLIEQGTQNVLEELGWQVVTVRKNESFGENSLLGREKKAEVTLYHYLLEALVKLNPNLSKTAYTQSIELIEHEKLEKLKAES